MKTLKNKLVKALKSLFEKVGDTKTPYDEWHEANETLDEVEDVLSFNEYDREYGNGEDVLYDMEELGDFGGDWDDKVFVLMRAYFGYKYDPFGKDVKEEFRPVDEYFYLNGYGNLVSVEEFDKYRYWAETLDEKAYVDAVEKEGGLEGLAAALGIEYKEEEEEEN